jgi:hypothetical protein
MPFCRFPMGGNAAILDVPAIGLVLDVNRLSAISPVTSRIEFCGGVQRY